jgi:hypothetical protein
MSAWICSGAVLYQSASLGATGTNLLGVGILPDDGFLRGQYLGSRFFLPQSAMITAVGNDVNSLAPHPVSPVIASIVSLSRPNALPSGMPFDSTTLGSAAFLPPTVSADVRVPLSLNLGPGWYGLIFSISGLELARQVYDHEMERAEIAIKSGRVEPGKFKLRKTR